MRFTFLFIFMLGCGAKVLEIKSHFSNGNEAMSGEARPYFDNFVTMAKCLNVRLHYNSLIIQIIHDQIDSVGECTWSSDGNMRIVIDAGRWDRLSFANREKTMIHELAHCALKKPHSDPNISAFPVMNPTLYTWHDYEFIYNYDFRVKEVFGATENTTCNFIYEDLEKEPGMDGTVMSASLEFQSSRPDEIMFFGESNH